LQRTQSPSNDLLKFSIGSKFLLKVIYMFEYVFLYKNKNSGNQKRKKLFDKKGWQGLKTSSIEDQGKIWSELIWKVRPSNTAGFIIVIYIFFWRVDRGV